MLTVSVPESTPPALIVRVSKLSPAVVPATESIVIAPPEELTVKSTPSASSIVPVAKIRVSVKVANSASAAKSMLLPANEVTVVAPSKLYKAAPKLRSVVASLPIFVTPFIPASLPSVASPIAPVIVIVPPRSSLELALLPSLIFNPPNSLEAPIPPVIVTAPVPDLITNTSLSPSSPDWIDPSKVTAPTPVPVSIVCVVSPHRATPEVPNLTRSLVVVKAMVSLVPSPGFKSI